MHVKLFTYVLSTKYCENVALICATEIQCEYKNFTSLTCSEFYFFSKKTENCKRYFTRIFCVQIYAKLQSFIQLALTLTKLWHTMRDYLYRIFLQFNRSSG